MSNKIKEEVRIEPISEERLEGFHACLDAVAREQVYLAMLQAPDLEETREFIEAGISNGVPRFVAVHHDSVVGWCDISPRLREGFRHCGDLGMGVLPEYRGKGLGKRLLQATVSGARNLGITRIELEVFASNTVAIGLYRRFGFAVEGVKKQARFLGDTYDDLAVMALLP